jgi:RNA polymerase sigma-32 factor
MSSSDVSFDGFDDGDEDGAMISPAGYIRDMRYNPERLASAADSEAERREQLESSLDKLDERSRVIIRRRWLQDPKSTLHELAEEYGVSAERIRQIEKRALNLMKDQLTA